MLSFIKAVSARRTRALSLLSTVGAIAVCTAAVGTGTASAGNGHGAVVQKNPYGTPLICNVVTAGLAQVWDFECTIHIVTTPSGTVNETLKGSVVGGSPLPSQAVQVGTALSGEECDPVSGAIYYIGTVTPSGNVNVKCSNSPF